MQLIHLEMDYLPCDDKLILEYSLFNTTLLNKYKIKLGKVNNLKTCF